MLAVGEEAHDLSREEAVQLRDALSDALTRRREFVRTACTLREDGKYVVERRNADSAGHEKVFESAEHCERLYERLPESFTAEDVGTTGLTGGRRHMLVWHYAENPDFECELVSRQPLTVQKQGVDDEAAAPGATTSDDDRETNSHMGVLPADD